MLINCPRCGFQQPQDKYCAQCGVDIENFKPAEASSFKKIFGNPLVQLSLLVVIAGGIGFTLFQQSKRDVAGLLTLSPSSIQVASGLSEDDAAPGSADAAREMEAASSEPFSGDISNDLAPTQALVEAAATPEDAAKAPGVDADGNKAAVGGKAGSPKLVIVYAEVQRGELQRIFEASQTTGQFMSFGDYAAGILPNVERKVVPSNLNIKILHREEKVLDSRAPLRWFFGKGDAGLGFFIEPTELDANVFRGNLEIRRSWPELNASQAPEIVRKSFPAIFEVASGAGFFVSGVLPRKTPLENDNEFTSIDVYKILRSPAFQKGDSEFVIFIEFDKSN